MIMLNGNSGEKVASVLPSVSVMVMVVPAAWLPMLIEITPCSELLKVWAMPEAPLPIKVPPVITALVS